MLKFQLENTRMINIYQEVNLISESKMFRWHLQSRDSWWIPWKVMYNYFVVNRHRTSIANTDNCWSKLNKWWVSPGLLSAYWFIFYWFFSQWTLSIFTPTWWKISFYVRMISADAGKIDIENVQWIVVFLHLRVFSFQGLQKGSTLDQEIVLLNSKRPVNT